MRRLRGEEMTYLRFFLWALRGIRPLSDRDFAEWIRKAPR